MRASLSACASGIRSGRLLWQLLSLVSIGERAVRIAKASRRSNVLVLMLGKSILRLVLLGSLCLCGNGRLLESVVEPDTGRLLLLHWRLLCWSRNFCRRSRRFSRLLWSIGRIDIERAELHAQVGERSRATRHDNCLLLLWPLNAYRLGRCGGCLCLCVARGRLGGSSRHLDRRWSRCRLD